MTARQNCGLFTVLCLLASAVGVAIGMWRYTYIELILAAAGLVSAFVIAPDGADE